MNFPVLLRNARDFDAMRRQPLGSFGSPLDGLNQPPCFPAIATGVVAYNEFGRDQKGKSVNKRKGVVAYLTQQDFEDAFELMQGLGWVMPTEQPDFSTLTQEAF